MFLDYLDTCRTARQTFGFGGRGEGRYQIDPLRLAGLMANRRRGSQLTEVRSYRGVPDGRRDPEGFSAALNQMECWRDAGVVVVRRPLEYPPGTSGAVDSLSLRQKALAIVLATDLVVLAWRDAYDVAMVCSTDEDLAPAIKAVLEQTWKTVDVAAWRSSHRPFNSLRVPAEDVSCHDLDAAVYEAVSDATDYSKPQ